MHKFWKLEKAWASAPNKSHARVLYDFLNDIEIMSYGDGGPVTFVDAQRICSGEYPWFFIFSYENELIGVAALLRSNNVAAELCLLLKKEWRGKGIGKEALSRLCAVACGALNLKKLYARVLESNVDAQRFFERCGFKKTSSLPEHLVVPNAAPSVYYEYAPLLRLPSLSIIIPVHNGAKWIAECLDSLDGVPGEIIVSDDGSDDETRNIVKTRAKKDERLRLLTLDGRRYAGGARNAALKVAKGEYISFLDADDRLCDKNVFRCMHAVASYSRADVICSSEIEFFDAIKRWRLPRGRRYRGIIDEERRPMMFYTQLPTWMSWFRRDYLDEFSIRFAEGVQSYEDNLFSFAAAATARSVVVVPGPLVSHRIRNDSLSHIVDVSVQTAFFDVVDMQLEYAATHGLLERYPAIMRNCFFHLVFLNATHVWRLLGRKHGWIIKRAVDFLRNVFPDLREQREMLNASETEKNDFAMAWDDVAKYLAYHRKEMDT